MTLPELPESFHWTTEAWGAALRCGPLEPVAPHLFSTRQLGLTAPADLDRLAAAVGAHAVVMVTQVHGNRVVVVSDGETLPSRETEADAILSRVPGVAVAVRAADCVPLLMADRASGAVAAVHAGWRGTAARVATTALSEMGRRFGTRPADVVAAVGPSIGPCCYEVGSELVDTFAAAGHERHLIDRWFATPPPPRGSRERPRLRLHVSLANRDQLVLAGVPEGHIFESELCTAMHPDVLTSYRAEKERAGRLAGVIMSKPV